MLEKPTGPGVIESTDNSAAGEWDMQERRSFPRTGLEMPVHLTVVPSGAENDVFVGNLEGRTRDVSRGGCAVLTDLSIDERTRCIARFPQTTGRIEPDTIWAEVRRSHDTPDGVVLGLEFETPLDTLRIAPAEPSDVSLGDGRKTLLVVDDQPGIRSLMERYLGDRGFEVHTAADGEQAFRMLTESVPDVLLLDLYLPRLNGHDLLRRMNEMDIAVDLIFTMSGYADTTDAQECLRLGAVDHLLKPVDVEHLHRSILLRLGTHPA